MVDHIAHFDVVLTKQVWYAGELLTGTVSLDAIRNFKVRGIRVYLRGRGEVQWKVRANSEQALLKEQQNLLDAKATVWGLEKGIELGGNDALPILSKGQHEWKFSFELPERQLPPSFESRSCTIRYLVRCIVDVPFDSNPSHEQHFTVLGPYTDCMQAKYLCPSCGVAQSRSWLCLPALHPVRLSATLERSAYCCGEHMKLRCQVGNSSELQLRISVKLMQHCAFYISKATHNIVKQLQHIAFEYRSDLIGPNRSIDWDLSRFLRLPPMPPSVHEEISDLLSIDYTLRVHLVRDGKSASNLCIDFPLNIVTLPFRIPNVAVPPLEFQSAVESVEGGMYISPAFCLGQVYDGADVRDDGLLYQPVYATVMKNPAKLQRQRLASIANGLNDCAEKVSSV